MNINLVPSWRKVPHFQFSPREIHAINSVYFSTSNNILSHWGNQCCQTLYCMNQYNYFIHEPLHIFQIDWLFCGTLIELNLIRCFTFRLYYEFQNELSKKHLSSPRLIDHNVLMIYVCVCVCLCVFVCVCVCLSVCVCVCV